MYRYVYIYIYIYVYIIYIYIYIYTYTHLQDISQILTPPRIQGLRCCSLQVSRSPLKISSAETSMAGTLEDLAAAAVRRGTRRGSNSRYHEPSAPSADTVPRSVFADRNAPLPEIPETKFPDYATHYMLWLTKRSPVAVIRCDKATRARPLEQFDEWMMVDRVCPIAMITDDHKSNCPTATASPPQGFFCQTVDNIVVASLRFKGVDPEYLCTVELEWEPSSGCFQSQRKRIGSGRWFRGSRIRVVPLPEGIESMISARHVLELMFTDDDENIELVRDYDDKIVELIYAATRGRV
jgi:hypothetical protein